MLFNDPMSFREDMLDGFVNAFSDYVVQVPGGVARATEMPKGKVAVINGGGSGHYPAFCGVVGEGFMDATVVGDIFTSPSTKDVLDIARSVENGSGILIIGGNYVGDKMNFDLARDMLIAEGIDARTFYITDDIASAQHSEVERRRGNVGIFIVSKIAGAASAAKETFDDIVRITSKANAHTRTMSVGFKGCTLPGAQEPKFHIPDGKMEVGQGIHGEAGIYENDLCTASEVAELLVEKVLAEAPINNSRRIGIILDGLGSTKYEELFVVWKSVSQLFRSQGYTLVDPLVGEFITSLDMAGIALSIIYLDDELEKFWKAPADTPSFKKGTVKMNGSTKRRTPPETQTMFFTKGSEQSRKLAGFIVENFEKMKIAIVAAEDELARIDSVAGDGDHGRGMVKGITYACEAAREALKNEAGAGSVITAAGKAWAAKAGGTSGVLWGEALMAAGAIIGDVEGTVTVSTVITALNSAANKIVALGHAHPGDKTMVDVLFPFIESLKISATHGKNMRESWKDAAATAEKAAKDTANLVPKIGRARPQARRSVGTPDAGAISMAICIRAVAK